MPTYEYSCPKCQKEFEVLRPMCDMGKRTSCPKCGHAARRLISVFASKAEYAIKVPTKGAFRGEKPKPAARAKAAPKMAKKPARKK